MRELPREGAEIHGLFDLIPKLRIPHRGKFETTAEHTKRFAALRGNVPKLVLLKVHRKAFDFDYDADAQSLRWDLGSYCLSDGLSWTFADASRTMNGFSHPRPVRGDGASFELRTTRSPQKSYVATNAFGMSRRIAKFNETKWLLYDDTLKEEMNLHFAEADVSKSEAMRVGKAYQTALLVDLSNAFSFETTTSTDSPTMDKPLDVCRPPKPTNPNA